MANRAEPEQSDLDLDCKLRPICAIFAKTWENKSVHFSFLAEILRSFHFPTKNNRTKNNSEKK